MKRLLAFILITFVATAPLSAKDAFGIKNGKNDNTTPQKRRGNAPVLVSFGTNLSSYLGEEGQWQLGYSFGITFNFGVYKNLSMTLPISYTRINAAVKNFESKSYSSDGNIYKTLFDREISVGFLDFPILFSYNFFPTKKYDLKYLLGTGLIIGVKDFWKPPDNVTITDEIIGTHNIDIHDFPLDPAKPSNTGVNINTGVRFHVSRFYIDVLYILYPYTIKGINKLNAISLRLGIDIH